MTVLAVLTVFGGSGEHLALLVLVLQNTGGNVAVLMVLAVSAVMAVSVVTANPPPLLNLTPLFRDPDMLSLSLSRSICSLSLSLMCSEVARLIRIMRLVRVLRVLQLIWRQQKCARFRIWW